MPQTHKYIHSIYKHIHAHMHTFYRKKTKQYSRTYMPTIEST
jgi:hypothetical protein